MIVGHEEVLARLTEPQASFPLLFVGIPSIGKWTVAEEMRVRWGISDSDVLRINQLSVTAARDAVQFASMAPVAGHLRLIIVRLHFGTEESQNVLLKAVEESPESTLFIFVTSGDTPLTTLLSRTLVIQFNRLSVDDLTTILEARGFKAGQARIWAERGEGQVKRALAYRDINETKPLVSAVVRAFREKDPRALEKAADGWTEAHTDLLVTWCNEAISRRWVVFSEEEADVRGRGIPMKILVALRADVRPKLVVKALLADVLRSMS